MRISRKSRDLLELLFILGFEVVEAVLTHPSFYKSLSYSSEQSYRRTIRLLKRNGWLAFDESDNRGDWVGNLTQEGRTAVGNLIDPKDCWESDWDGKWRVFTFDLPSKATAERQALRKWLISHRFGRLQGSVWITPQDLGDWSAQLSKLNIDPTEFVFVSGSFGGARENRDYIGRAWDFDLINERYRDYQKFLADHPPRSTSAEQFGDWYREERAKWELAFSADPFLPKMLWPEDFHHNYQGPKSLALRQNAYAFWKSNLLS